MTSFIHSGMTNPSRELQTLISLAREEAGPILMRYYGNCTTETKADGSQVTAAEKEVAQKLNQRLQECGYLVMNEETYDPSAQSPEPDQGICWVDSVDGSEEYIRQTGRFWTLIGVARRNIPVLGVAYNAATRELFCAEGGSCWQEKEGQLSLVQLVEPPASLEELRLAWTTDRVPKDSALESMAQALGIKQIVGVGIGPGNKVTAILKGEADVFIHPGRLGNRYGFPWDDCAPHALLRNACSKTGSPDRMTDLLGQELLYDSSQGARVQGLLATTGVYHSRILERVRPVIGDG